MSDLDGNPPTDDVARVLQLSARHFGLGYSKAFLEDVVRQATMGESAYGITQAAPRLGLKVTAGTVGLGELRDLGVPDDDSMLVLHFPLAGFGRLERVDARGFHLFDTHGGSRSISNDKMGELWEGTVLVFERDEQPGENEPHRFWRRLAELVTGDHSAALQFAGPRSAVWLRTAIFLIAFGLAVFHVAGAAAGLLPLLLVGLQACGLLLSYSLLRIENGTSDLAEKLCGPSGGCETLLNSAASKIAGISLASIGLAFFGAQLILLAVLGENALELVGALSGPAALAGLALIAQQLRAGTFCRLCMLVHAASTTSFAVYLWHHSGGWPATDGVWEMTAAWAVLCALLLFGVVPHLAGGSKLTATTIELKLARQSPFAALERIALAPREPMETDFGVVIAGRGRPLRLLLCVSPDCIHSRSLMDEIHLWPERFGRQFEVCVTVPHAGAADWRAGAILAIALAAEPDDTARVLQLAFRQTHLQRAALLRAEDPAAALAMTCQTEKSRMTAHVEAATRLGEAATALLARHGNLVPLLALDGRILLRGYTEVLAALPILTARYPHFLHHILRPGAGSAPRPK